ncbi:MAG: hypothetical protein E7Z66_03845 [Thermoplasmata archaeon]|nr:hypothetical protein [Thermoplasmata archaeon]
MRFETSGYTSDGLIRTELNGEISYGYLHYDETKGYLMGHESYTVYDTGYSTYTGSYSDTYWTSENSGREWTPVGKETIDTIYGPIECDVVECKEGGSVERQWSAGWITYKIEYTSTQYSLFFQNVTYMEYVLEEVFTFENEDEYDITIYADLGVTVTGYGTHDAFSTVTLTAEVDKSKTSGFYGWVDENGRLLSDELEYTVDLLLSDTVVYALNQGDPDYSLSDGEPLLLETPAGLTDVEWKFYDEYGDVTNVSDVTSYDFDSAGRYEVYYSGKESDGRIYNGYYTVFADGATVKTFTWDYDGKKETYSIEILYSDLSEYRSSPISRSFVNSNYTLNYVTTDDPYLIKIAEDFLKRTEGMADEEVIQYVLVFVQNIEYQSDSDFMGQSEYWKYPLETLYDQGGDCEDTSILMSTILSLMGHDSVLAMYPGHMAPAVELNADIENGFYYLDNNGNKYYYCETTGTGYDLGENPNRAAYNNKTMTYETFVSAIE